MKLYLSAYKLGDSSHVLREWTTNSDKRVAYIPNAFDVSRVSIEIRRQHVRCDIAQLLSLNLEPELLDLRDFFGKADDLKRKLGEYNVIWVSGGSPFALRQAIHLSGFEEAIEERSGDPNFVYGAYSAGCCVLSPTLSPYAIIEDAQDYPYAECQRTIWEGLNILPYVYLPHYKSNHPSSQKIDEELDFCIQKGLPYKAFRDGEVLLIDEIP